MWASSDSERWPKAGDNVLRAQRDAKLAKLLVGVGETLVVDQPILEFE
jgi:hypothetical protein